MKVNFEIRKSGSVQGLQEYIAVLPCGKLLSNITPHLEQSMRRSKRFFTVVHGDGKVEIADGLEHAADLIAEKYF